MNFHIFKTKAVIDLPRHNAAFCRNCFKGYVHDQVARAIKSQKMFRRADRILVAVSGGKDSLALWDILLKLGYQADALYVNLGIGTYSEESFRKVRNFADAVAASHGAKLLTHTVEKEEGAGIKELAQLTHRPTCSTCGTIKRYQFNRAAVENDYDVMATGHNLDDEAAGLCGRVRQEGETALSPVGTRARRLCGLEPNRLHHRRMPYGERGKDARLQGSPQSAGNRIARHEADLLLGFSRQAE